MSDEHKLKLDAFSRFSQTLGARADYVQGGGGNTSVKLNGRLMAIKASGYCLSDITPDKAYAVVDYAALTVFYHENEPGEFPDLEAAGSAQLKAAQQQIEGMETLRPSVEAGFHSLLSTFVGHTHSVYANIAGCCREGGEILQQALQGADYTAALVPYINPGAELTFSIRKILKQAEAADGRRPSVLLLLNHGVIAHDEKEERCLAIHEDVTRRLMDAFKLQAGAFPHPVVNQAPDGAFVSGTAWLHSRLKGDEYPDSLLLGAPLYPDQMVFFKDTLGNTAVIDRESGFTRYQLPQKTAQTLEETLCAVVFIMETIRRHGLTLTTMGDAARRFIDGWESEKYRKSLAEKQA